MTNGTLFQIGLGSCGLAHGGAQVKEALEKAARAAGAGEVVKVVGCNGMCHWEPLVEVMHQDGTSELYGGVTPTFARALVFRHLGWRGRVKGALRSTFEWFRNRDSNGTPAPLRLDPTTGPSGAYLRKQKRIVLENCGVVDPSRVDDYIARDGYRALDTCLKSTPEAVVAAVKESGLRGRGGAGFPTGVKWSLAASQPETQRFVIMNGDEGDPGAFMDRLVLEADPHRVIEGLAIAAYAIGADRGYLYIRAEYPLAVRRIRAAIIEATERGFLGDHVLGSEFRLHLQVREGAGAFVCGEETALMASIEGERGMPRLRPPFPAQKGLWGKPTVINNVETLACLPWILRHGPQAFASVGTKSSSGTKVFALAGKINRGGLIEVPMGITIREIVEDIGGGIPEGREFKAVQIGGPAGGCLPASLADTPIDYEELAQSGAIMGSGGLVVLDDQDCMVDIARFFIEFVQAESCGKCTFCRIGTKRMLEILERLCAGQGRPHDIDDLEELAHRVKRTSLCGLGQAAPNPVLTTLRYFRDEYESHLRDGRCPAGRCKELVDYHVMENCTGCTLCAQACPVDAIDYRPYERHEVDDATCTRCGMCVVACQDNAIEVV